MQKDGWLYYRYMQRVFSFLNIVPEPFLFNPLKHHLGFIALYSREREEQSGQKDIEAIRKELRHIGSAVMDIYTGWESPGDICSEILNILRLQDVAGNERFRDWVSGSNDGFRVLKINDDSEWILKYNDSDSRFIHFFPARSGPLTIRTKANTLRSALLYLILIGKDYISGRDLNHSRSMVGLPPVRSALDAEAISSLIEIIRNFPALSYRK